MIALWHNYQRMRSTGVLGMNCRNVEFISRYNERRLYPLVDDKLQTKLLAQDYGVPTPKLQFVVNTQHEVNGIESKLEALDSFVLKPAEGSGGKGILVVTGRAGENFVKASGAEISIADVKRHMTNTLAGLHSLGGRADVVIVEDVIAFDDQFAGYSFEGVPDIRIVVFRGYPVMAMMRLATHASDGKANLHQGAVGVGLAIDSGRCLNAVQHSRRVTHHPDTGLDLGKIDIPDWRDLLLLAAQCHDMTGLGYLGADIVLDKNLGPQLLELNARPGLSIQIANGRGLLPRLRHLETLPDSRRWQAARRVDYVIEHFREDATAH